MFDEESGSTEGVLEKGSILLLSLKHSREEEGSVLPSPRGIVHSAVLSPLLTKPCE